MLILSDRKKKTTIAAGIIAAIGGLFAFIKHKKNKNLD